MLTVITKPNFTDSFLNTRLTCALFESKQTVNENKKM